MPERDEPLLPLELELADNVRELARAVARAEVASLCGLMLRRLQGVGETAGAGGRLLTIPELSSMFGEALRDFSAATSEPGPESD